MWKLVIFIVATALLNANPRSVVLTSGKSARIAAPAFSVTAPMRIELRLHNRTLIHGSNFGWILQSTGYGPYIWNYQNSSTQIYCQVDGVSVPLVAPGGFPQDMTIRLQRDPVSRKVHCELWNAQTGTRVVAGTGSVGTARSLASGFWTLGGTQNSSSVAFFRVYSTLVPLNSPQPSTPGGDILQLEFNDSGLDVSGNNRAVSWINGPPAFQNTPVYTPICSAGVTDVFRAGEPLRLDGTGSVVFNDDSAPILLWQTIRKPTASSLTWSSHSSAQPVITGTTFGTHEFRLVVTDSLGQQTSCSVKHGVVAYEDDGTVLLPEETPQDLTRNKLLGKLIAFGKNPWAWESDRHQALANYFGTQLITGNAPGYPTGTTLDWWNDPDPGTVTVANNSTKVYGVGTQFTSGVCGKLTAVVTNPGAGYTSVPSVTVSGGSGTGAVAVAKIENGSVAQVTFTLSGDGYQSEVPQLVFSGGGGSGASATVTYDPTQPRFFGSGGENNIVFWYPDSRTPGRIGRDVRTVSSCESDTELTLSSPYRRTTTGLSGAAYTFTRARTGYWMGNVTHANFYDNVLAHYAMYYRSGLDTYLEYARLLADRWWQSPYMDEGRACPDFSIGGYCRNPRDYALTGLTIRALEKNDPDMWHGLRRYWDMFRLNIVTNKEIGDMRENAYEFLFVAHCALADPDAAHAAQCAASLNTSWTNKWSISRRNVPGTVLHNMFANSASVYMGGYSPGRGSWMWPCSLSQPTCGTVTVTKGSDIVVGSGTNWDKSWLANTTFGEKRSFAYFWAADNFLSGDEIAYPLNGCLSNEAPDCIYNAILSPTQLKLSRPYEGPTRSGIQWGIGRIMGYGVQPFMAGIAAVAMVTGYEATGNQAMRTAAIDIVNWLTDYGMQETTKGLYYGRGFPSCQDVLPGPPPEGLSLCSYNSLSLSDKQGSRFLNGEVSQAFARVYPLSKNDKAKRVMDTLYNAAFAKPGWPIPDGFSYDDMWLKDFEDGTQSVAAGFSITASKNKDYAFYFGMGQAYSWPAARRLDKPAPELRTFRIYFNRGTAPKAQLTLTEATGVVSTTGCDASPCIVTTRTNQAEYLLTIDYLSAAGKVIGRGQPLRLKP